MVTFSLREALGVHSDSVEFQVDRTIVWVLSSSKDRAKALDEAQRLFPTIWAARLEVVSCAERALALMCGPGSQRSHWRIAGMAVRGIWIDPRVGTADYDVWFSDLSEDSPDEQYETSVMVTRSASGSLASRVHFGA